MFKSKLRAGTSTVQLEKAQFQEGGRVLFSPISGETSKESPRSNLDMSSNGRTAVRMLTNAP